MRKDIRQWMLRITKYAEKLLADLDTLDWHESIKLMQCNWIGRSEGANVIFPLADGRGNIEVYTTRPDTPVRRHLHGPFPGTSSRGQDHDTGPEKSGG